MINLLKETLEWLRELDIPESNVEWVGGDDMWFTWEDFKKLADFDYDEGYGGEEVAIDLIVVGKDWWLERHEYDGSEWWEFKRKPTKKGREYNLPVGIATVDYNYKLREIDKYYKNNGKEE